MRNIPLPILRGALFGAAPLIDLLELHVTGYSTPDLRFAIYDRDVVFQGQTYIAGGFQQNLRTRDSMQDSLGELQLTLPDVDSEIIQLVEGADLPGSLALLRRIHLGRKDSMELYRGVVRAPVVVEGTTVAITLVPQSTDGESLITVPRRVYGNGCGWRFGGPECGVNLEDWTYEGTVGEGSNGLTIRDSALTDADIEALKSAISFGPTVLSALPADLIMDSGVNERQARPIASLEPCKIVLRKPYYAAPAEGDTFRIVRRCPKSHDACDGFANLDNFGGFPHVPKEPRNLRRELAR